MLKGTIHWTDEKQNCGFIIPDDDSQKNIFIHVSQFKKLGIELPENGQRVWFEMRKSCQHSILDGLPELMPI